MTVFNLVFAAIPLAGLIYLSVLYRRDMSFYKSNNFDYSKSSGVPDFWIRMGPKKIVLSPKQRLWFGYPVFALILIGLMILFLVAK